MEKTSLRTLHPAPARSDLISQEQQLTRMAAQLRALRCENATLAEQVRQLVDANAALTDRVQRLEQSCLVFARETLKQPEPAPSPLSPSAARQQIRPVLAHFSAHSGVFGNHRLERSQIASVIVLSTLSDAPKDAWDISLQKDGSVLAWVKKAGGSYALFLAGEGGITAPPDSSYLFSNYSSLTSLNLGRSFFTGRVTDMSWMFSSCSKLTSLDLSCFNTANVTDMSWMFADCHSLASLNLSGFQTEHVRNMSRMFTDCYVLSSIQISSFRTDSAADLRYMFTNCSGLTPKVRAALRDKGFPV
ncbi:MAG: BspA family leucine-rich repeat surface protein [Candidatus Onthomonas sp.]